MRDIIKDYKVIGIVGSRRRDEAIDLELLIKAFFEIYVPGDKIISGGCKQGGDKFAEWIAAKLNLTEENGGLIIHRPKELPKGSQYLDYVNANYARNTLIAEDCDVLLALVARDRKGGTENTIKTATKLGREIILL